VFVLQVAGSRHRCAAAAGGRFWEVRRRRFVRRIVLADLSVKA
jgi:hypothetical protein